MITVTMPIEEYQALKDQRDNFRNLIHDLRRDGERRSEQLRDQEKQIEELKKTQINADSEKNLERVICNTIVRSDDSERQASELKRDNDRVRATVREQDKEIEALKAELSKLKINYHDKVVLRAECDLYKSRSEEIEAEVIACRGRIVELESELASRPVKIIEDGIEAASSDIHYLIGGKILTREELKRDGYSDAAIEETFSMRGITDSVRDTKAESGVADFLDSVNKSVPKWNERSVPDFPITDGKIV